MSLSKNMKIYNIAYEMFQPKKSSPFLYKSAHLTGKLNVDMKRKPGPKWAK